MPRPALPKALTVQCVNDAHLRHYLRYDAERWEIVSELGVSMHAMRELGHWPNPYAPTRYLCDSEG